MFTTLITCEDLARHLDDPSFVIIDCRFDLLAPDWGRADYQHFHIPGSRFADLNQELSSPAGPTTGRHPLPDAKQFRAVMSRLGVDASKQVVVLDTLAGAFAARLWWLLRLYGHTAVAVLEGGLSRWKQCQYPLVDTVELFTPSTFTGEPQPGRYFTTPEMEILYEDPAYRVIDARARTRYLGETEPIDPVAGHIPGAVNRFHSDNLSKGGMFRTPQELREQFLELLDGVPPERAVIYCGSGVTSCFHLLAMEFAGLPGARLYPGSWSEWIRDPARPVAVGENDLHTRKQTG